MFYTCVRIFDVTSTVENFLRSNQGQLLLPFKFHQQSPHLLCDCEGCGRARSFPSGFLDATWFGMRGILGTLCIISTRKIQVAVKSNPPLLSRVRIHQKSGTKAWGTYGRARSRLLQLTPRDDKTGRVMWRFHFLVGKVTVASRRRRLPEFDHTAQYHLQIHVESK